ncbi:MAG: hypothetical protein FRX48_09586 [Lasallia pustulata]|uniref:Uncharacterized protein n=1 Tax=Lasallia pustulata TaxID=136370 RepID=A0A5M8PCJ1_9LECA|nr:MAG: hypothetical protein FRX48_09586 [Lasallia pustulata]
MAPLLTTVSYQTSIISAIIISHYDPLHSAAQLEAIFSAFLPSKGFQRPQLPSFIQRPSSALFAVACPFYAISTLSFYQLHKADLYQDHWLIIGVILSLFFCLHLPTQVPIAQRLQTCLPFGVNLALLASALMHWLMPSLRSETAPLSEEARYPAEKISAGI